MTFVFQVESAPLGLALVLMQVKGTTLLLFCLKRERWKLVLLVVLRLLLTVLLLILLLVLLAVLLLRITI